MKFIEPHIHMVSRTTDDYERMLLAGIVACVEPSFWAGTDRSAVASFEDYWEHMIGFETARARKYGLEHYVMLSLNPKEANNDMAHDVVSAMEKYLDREAVIGIGEIGLDRITSREEEIFVRQLHMANNRKMPVIIHTPHHNKKVGTERIIDILRAEKVDQGRIIIDHNTEETIELSRKTDCYCGMTVYYVSKLSPERVVNILTRFGTDRMIINGSADWGYSDPLAVPKTAIQMRKSGFFPEEEIKKVFFDNPFSFLRQSPNFKLEP
jgi:hypothetical protein